MNSSDVVVPKGDVVVPERGSGEDVGEDVASERSSDLDQRIRRFIARGDTTEVAFDRLALDLFAYQYASNPAYHRYCDRLGHSPSVVRHWAQAPAMPTSAFAHVRLACFPPEQTKLTFVSSGTTRASRSRHELDSSTLYDASLLTHFRERVVPDMTEMQIVALSPPFAKAPHSSLAYMLSKISEIFGTPRDGFFIDGDALDFEGACAALRQATQPVLVIGTAFGFVHFFDRCFASGARFELPVGSRVVETGGFKGKSREVQREELYGWFAQVLGVPRVLCLSEYGMCELGSQWYDANLGDYFTGRPARANLKVGPHWARTLVVDPLTAQPLPDGEAGLLQIFDLTNRGSVAAILTGDLARHVDGGFELLGRAAGEPPKGCSIALDAALEESHGD